jgi:hypothetical protein
MYLFLDFILKTLTFFPLNWSRILYSTFIPSTVGVPIFVSFPSSSEISRADVESVESIAAFSFFTSIISPALTVN